MNGSVVVDGVTVSRTLSCVKHARKYVGSDGHWVLATRRGIVIAMFLTEARLDAWWQMFQVAQGREANQLVNGKPTPSTRHGKRGKHRGPRFDNSKKQGLGNRVGPDYLKPWSKQYNMPEYDFE